jgi:hypothetical protein
MLASAKAWEVAAAIAGGYLAAKNMENLTRREFFIYLVIAVLFGFMASDFIVLWLTEPERGAYRLSLEAAAKLYPLAVIVLSAMSLKLLDVAYGWIAQVKELRIKDIKINFFKGKK